MSEANDPSIVTSMTPANAFPEIVIGLVGAVGTDLDRVEQHVGAVLRSMDYSPVSIQLTTLLRGSSLVPIDSEYDDSHYEKRIGARMTAGDEARRQFGSDALAHLAIEAIQSIRRGQGTTLASVDEAPSVGEAWPSHAWVIRSLKHEAEVRLLREVYGEAFFLLAVHASRDSRKKWLQERIRKSHHRHRADDPAITSEQLAVMLIARDEEEADLAHGQQVRRTFWRGDAYIDTTPNRPAGPFPKKAKEAIDRILHSYFGHPYITPTRDEYAMFIARAAAYRSASMGRQVGAVIADSNGSVISTGTNEAPRFPGGQYWDGDDPDGRDHVLGSDPSDVMKQELVEDTVDRLKEVLLKTFAKAGWTPPAEPPDFPARELVKAMLRDPAMKNAEFQAITEYQRPVHAEMSAITDATRRGVPTDGATLYCTTFPCHGCARHIVSSGIRRVVFIEPYPKTLVTRLYPDSIVVDEQADDRVSFVPFIGIAPRRYLSLFKMPKSRKDKDGIALEWNSITKRPRVNRDETWACMERENKAGFEWVQRLKSRRAS